MFNYKLNFQLLIIVVGRYTLVLIKTISSDLTYRELA